MATRKRVNVKVLGVVLSAAAAAAVGSALGYKYLVRPDPRPHILAGDAAARAGHWKEAAVEYGKAVGAAPGNTQLLVRYGEIAHNAAAEDPEYAQKEYAAYTHALEIDPRDVLALDHLVRYNREVALLSGRADAFERLRDSADRLADLDAGNPDVKYAPFAVIQGWLGGVETPPAKIDTAVARLTALLDKQRAATTRPAAVASTQPNGSGATPAAGKIDPDLPTWIAQAAIRRAGDDFKAGKAEDGKKDLARARDLFDKLLAENDQDAALQYRAYSIYATLARVDGATATGGAGAPGVAAARALARADADKASKALDRASALADATDPLYIDIRMTSALVMLGQGDRAGAARTLRELYAANPRNPIVRLQLAKVLGDDPATRQEAIEVLAKNEGDTLQGVQSGLSRYYDVTSRTQLTLLRIAAYAEARGKHDDKGADALARQVDDGLARLDGAAGESPKLSADIADAKGRWQMVRGDTVGAIQSLDRARTLAEQAGPGDAAAADDIGFRLAMAYLGAQQTGQAKTILEALSKAHPENAQIHRTLVALYGQENDADDARRHYEALKKLLPNDAGVARMGLMFADRVKDKQEIDQQLATMPESSKQDRLRKAVLAEQFGRNDEALRLLSEVHSADLTDGEAARALARYYLLTNQKDKAAAVVAESIKAGSTDGQLKVLATAIEKGAGDRAAIDAERLAVINGEKDPFQRELQLAAFYQEQGKSDEVLKHLDAARAIRPDDGQLADMEFQFYCGQAQASGNIKSPAAVAALAKAEAELPILAKTNRDQAGGDLFVFRLQMTRQDYVGALATARKLTQQLPDFAQSWLTYGQAFQALGQPGDAAKQYLLALDRQNNNSEALRGLIQCSYQLGRPEEALRYIRRGIAAAPRDASFRNMELAYQLRYGDPTTVIPVREAALKANPSNPQAYADLGLTYVRCAEVKRQAGDTTAATEFAKNAWDTFGKAKDKWPDEKTFYRDLADLALSGAGGADGLSKAEAALKELAARPALKDDADPHLMLANFYTRLNRAGEAQNEFDEAIRRRPDDATYLQYATFLGGRGRYSDALAALDKCKPSAQVTGQRVDLLVSAGRLKDADAVVTAALAKAPDDASLNAMLAMVAYRSGDMPRALSQANKALAVNDSLPLALYYRGLANLNAATGDLQAAIADLTKVRDAAPGDVDARVSLAEALRRNNDPDGAIREVEAAFRLAPGNKALRAMLIESYSAVSPPRWDDAQRLLDQAEADPGMKNDPQWPQMESAMWAARKDLGKAADAAARAVELSNRQPVLVRNYIAILLEAKRYDEALAQTDKLLGAAGGQSIPAWVHLQRGLAHNGKGDRAAAMTDFESGLRAAFAAGDDAAAAQVANTIAKAIGVDDALKLIADRAHSDAKMQRLASLLYQTKGDLDDATAMAEKALANPALTSGDRPAVLRVLGGLYLSYRPEPKADKALDVYKKLLEVAPDDPEALNNISCILVDDLDRPQEALAYIQRARDEQERAGRVEPLLLDTYGWTLVRCGRVGEGTNALLQAADRKSFPDVYYHLGEAYLLGNQPEESIKQFKHAADLLEHAKLQDVAMKQRVEAGLKKATEQVRAKGEAKLPIDTKSP